jgi:asparagine synthase (glutamine-hydrolysing)
MCGILGLQYSSTATSITAGQFDGALSEIHHRGPDNATSIDFDGKTFLGHVRLSIIDLEARSNQPFFDSNDRYCIVYNGEIYNFLELKKKLEGLGYVFRTTSDTEVVLYAYLEWGAECVQSFNGMWAFSIYDTVTNNLFLSRDRFGVKPLVYHINKDSFVFSSEIKPIIKLFPELKKPNLEAISNYFKFNGGAHLKETWFESIYRIPPGHNATIISGQMKLTKYWDFPSEEPNTPLKLDGLIAEYKAIFKDAVNIRYRSDVPFGITLSSGLDSNSILFNTEENSKKKMKAYSLGIDTENYNESEVSGPRYNIERRDESDFAELNAQNFGVIFHRENFNKNQFIDDLNKCIYHLESGHQSTPIVPYFQLMKSIKEDGRVVILEGQGADELLAGYVNPTGAIYLIELIFKFKWKEAIEVWRNSNFKAFQIPQHFLSSINDSLFRELYNALFGVSKFLKSPLKNHKRIELKLKRKQGEGLLNYHLRKEHREVLVNLLHYGDAISMANSIESRLPFMDYRLVEFAFKLPSTFKIRNGIHKWIQREAMKGVVPDYILEDRVKLGFNYPLLNIFLSKEKDSPRSILLSEKCKSRGLFNVKKIESEFDRLEKNASNLTNLYKLLTLELWYRTFIDEPKATV